MKGFLQIPILNGWKIRVAEHGGEYPTTPGGGGPAKLSLSLSLFPSKGRILFQFC